MPSFDRWSCPGFQHGVPRQSLGACSPRPTFPDRSPCWSQEVCSNKPCLTALHPFLRAVMFLSRRRRDKETSARQLLRTLKKRWRQRPSSACLVRSLSKGEGDVHNLPQFVAISYMIRTKSRLLRMISELLSLACLQTNAGAIARCGSVEGELTKYYGILSLVCESNRYGRNHLGRDKHPCNQ
jgi:hypothetical protein